MNAFIYGSYILIWPALTLVVMVVICGAVIRDSIQDRKDKKNLL